MNTGLERLLQDPGHWLGRAKVGLLTNPSAVSRDLIPAVDLLHAHPAVNLQLLFGPEHGIRGTAQYMVAVEEARDPDTGLRVVSLYGKDFASLTPKTEDLEEVDLLLFDIQDIGARYYTYAATLALCMRAAAANEVKVVVLDRPNPIGGAQIEGGGLEPGLENFCALYPVPQRHGLTVGELARLYNDSFGIACNLQVVPCQGWRRSDYFDQCGFPWVMPSPNIPTLETAVVYPGMCLLEGTNLSEGRGTTRPFELFGAPFIDPKILANKLQRLDLPGVRFRPCTIEPAWNKFAGLSCGALQLHVTDRLSYNAYRTGVAVLLTVRSLWPQDFTWRREPYEFRADVPAIDLLTGSPKVRKAIDAGDSLDDVMQVACGGIDTYLAGYQQALLYD